MEEDLSSENFETNNSQKDSDSNSIQFLTFNVGEEIYGIDLGSIREIKGWALTTKLPNSPDYMKGVINLRGVVIPIFDLRRRFNMGETEPDEKNVVIIVSIGEKLIGVLVDAVSDIVTVDSSELRQAPSVEAKIDENYIKGLISIDEKMIVILKIEDLFDSETIKDAEKFSASNSTGN